MSSLRVDLYASEKFRIEERPISRAYDLRRLAELTEGIGQSPKPSVIIGTAGELSKIDKAAIEGLREVGVRVIVTDAMPGSPMPRFERDLIHCTLPTIDEREEWRILSAFIVNAIDLLSFQEQARRTQSDLEELTQIGVLLSSEKDTNKLLELILTKSREITNCDAGSLYLVDEKENERRLIFKLAQNDSIPLNLGEFPIPLNKQSLIGYTVLTGEPLVINNAYEIDPELPYAHARWVDKNINYRTITMLSVPLKNIKGEVVGGLSLINRKRDFKVRLVDPLTAMVMVQPFDEHSINLVSSLASQAAVTLEKNMLYESIQNLFEGFVKGSVKTIESRDPTTSGHSERVALLTVGLAEEINRTNTGPYSQVYFSEEQIRELRYASLLHDFGKVMVSEEVLVKAKKLYPEQIRMIRMRFDFIKAAIKYDSYKKRFQFIKEHGYEEFLRRQKEFDNDAEEAVRSLEEDLNIIWQSNEPTVLEEDNFKALESIIEKVYSVFEEKPLRGLTDDEANLLKIPRGTLSSEEMKEIQSHVSHTYQFLQEIPWTKELMNVPDIASKHHEALNGKGYPLGLLAKDISIEARMMAIADIFDALTAKDRPYKPAVPIEKALQIIQWECEAGKLDQELYNIFKEKDVWKVVMQDEEPKPQSA